MYHQCNLRLGFHEIRSIAEFGGKLDSTLPLRRHNHSIIIKHYLDTFVLRDQYLHVYGSHNFVRHLITG